MDPFRDYGQAMSAVARCRRSARCAICAGRPEHIAQHFFAIVRDAFSPAEMILLAKAANSAFL